MSQISPLSANQIKCFACGIDIMFGIKYFNSQGPCRGWWNSFKKKHPKVKSVLRVVEFLKHKHLKLLSFSSISEYLTPLQEIITAFDLDDKPDHFWTCSEYSLNLNLPSDNCFFPSRERYLSFSRRLFSKNNYASLMLAGSASGEIMSPFIVYKNNSPPEEFKKKGLPTAMYTQNETGFVDSELIFTWFQHTFLPQCPKDRSADKPVLLLLNSNFLLAPQKMFDLALAENVILLSLMPHLHHACHPLDNLFVKGLCKNLTQILKHNPIQNEAFANKTPQLIKELFEKRQNSQMIIEGFKICGVFPLSVGVDPKPYLDLHRQLNFEKSPSLVWEETLSKVDVGK